jgi:Tubulin-tyrosine ligase family
MCFEVLGFDILVDEDLKPWLLEVNFTPSFTTDSQLDLRIKTRVVTDILRLITVPNKSKKEFDKFHSKYMKKRVTGKRSLQEHEELRMIAQDIRNEYEDQHKGGFIKIYPGNDHYLYLKYLKLANIIWTGGNISMLRIPRIRNSNNLYTIREKANENQKESYSPSTPLKLAGARTSSSRMKIISRALNFNSVDGTSHYRSKSYFASNSTDL